MDALPSEVLVHLLSFVGGRELGRLELASRRFSSLASAPPIATSSLEPEPEAAGPAEPALPVTELAARFALSRRSDTHRVALRPGEKACFALHVLEERLASPPSASAGYCHTALANV